MNIENAFLQQVIERAGTDTTDEEEIELRDMVSRLLAVQELDITDEVMADKFANIAILFFIAGRTDQTSRGIKVTLTQRMAQEILNYLAEKEGDVLDE